MPVLKGGVGQYPRDGAPGLTALVEGGGAGLLLPPSSSTAQDNACSLAVPVGRSCTCLPQRSLAHLAVLRQRHRFEEREESRDREVGESRFAERRELREVDRRTRPRDDGGHH